MKFQLFEAVKLGEFVWIIMTAYHYRMIDVLDANFADGTKLSKKRDAG